MIPEIDVDSFPERVLSIIPVRIQEEIFEGGLKKLRNWMFHLWNFLKNS